MAPVPHWSFSSVGAQVGPSGYSSFLYIALRAQRKAPRLSRARSAHKQEDLGFAKSLRSWQGPVGRKELRLMQVAANSKAGEPLPPEMSMENALRILGVAEGAAFEEILRAKNSLLGRHSRDSDFTSQVEAAYEVLLMKSLMQRRLGKVADSSIRYADVKMARTNGGLGGLQWLSEALNRAPVTADIPTTTAIGTQTAVYAGLAVWTLASEVSSHPSFHAKSDVPGLILAVGVGASIHFLTKRNVKLGKAIVLTFAGLVVGSVFGGAVESFLRVDLVPVLGIGSPAAVVSEFILISLWLTSLYLR